MRTEIYTYYNQDNVIYVGNCIQSISPRTPRHPHPPTPPPQPQPQPQPGELVVWCVFSSLGKKVSCYNKTSIKQYNSAAGTLALICPIFKRFI